MSAQKSKDKHFPREVLKIPYDEKNARALGCRIIFLLKFERNSLKQRVLAKEIGWTESQLSKWCNGHSGWDTITPERFANLIGVLQRLDLLVTEEYVRSIEAFFPASAYHAISTFWEVEPANVDFVIKECAGIYRIYRPSMFFPGHTFVGRFEIYFDASAKAIRCAEFYTSRGSEDLPLKEFHLTGFCIPQRNYMMIVSKPINSGDVQVKYITDALPFDNSSRRTSHMHGCVSDMQGGRIYTAPLLFERADGTSDWRLCANEKLPLHVKSKFDTFPSQDFLKQHIAVF
jgi:hypothetical protein